MTIARGVLLTLVVCAAGGCAGPRSSPSPAEAPGATQPATPALPSAGAAPARATTLVVYGMGCPLCANNLDKQLLRVPGVEAVDVNLGSGHVVVTFADGAAPPARARLARAVADSGYTLVRVVTP